MCSSGISGEGELRGQLANRGSHGKMSVKMGVCAAGYDMSSLSSSTLPVCLDVVRVQLSERTLLVASDIELDT